MAPEIRIISPCKKDLSSLCVEFRVLYYRTDEQEEKHDEPLVEADRDVDMTNQESVAAAAPIRAATELFLADFIRENGITPKTRFGPDLEGRLDAAARLHNPGGTTLTTLIRRIRALAQQAAPQD